MKQAQHDLRTRRGGDVVGPLTCQAAVRVASDQLAGLLSDAERATLEEHLAGCDSCSYLRGQLYRTIAVLGSRPNAQVPDAINAMVAGAEGDRAEAVAAQLPHLYALANALDADAADDLVQDTLTSALADARVDTTASGLARALTRLAAERRPVLESPAAPTGDSDADADEPELVFAGLFTEGRYAGAWVDPPAAWGVARVLRPEDDVVTAEELGVVDAALAELDPIDAGLVTLVDIETTPFSQAVIELDLASVEARERLARARFAVRSALDRYLRS